MRRAARGEDDRSNERGFATGSDALGSKGRKSNISGDHLEYLLDMILEMRSMAERAETHTLAGILDLAYREARLQVDQHHER